MQAILKLNTEFNRSVIILIMGTTIGQAIPIAIIPILTRLYTPKDFGIFALYTAVATLFSVIATGRYELAIMLPKKEQDAASLVLISIIMACFMSVFSAGLLFIFNQPFTQFLGNPDISYWLYWIPLSILFTGIYQALNYWNNRQKQFKRLALSRIAQGSSTATAQLGLGINTPGAGGLILGNISGQVMATIVFGHIVWKNERHILKSPTKARIIANLKKFRKFPLLSTWGALLDNTATQVPIFILTRFFSLQLTGFFSLTFRALNLPMALIANSIAQVLFQKILSLHNQQPQLLFNYILKTFFLLLTLTLPIIGFMFLFGEQLFAIVFGANWVQAGTLAAPLSIVVAIRFSVSPLSMVLAMEHNLKAGFLWQLCYFITITSTLLFAAHFDITYFVWILVAHEIILYGFYLYLILRGSRQR